MKKSILNDLYADGAVCTEVNGTLVPYKFTDVETETQKGSVTHSPQLSM